MRRVCVVPSATFLPLSSVKLGRLITSIEQPHQAYHDPETIHPNSQPLLRSGYTGEHYAASDVGFVSALTSLVSARFSKGAKLKTCIATDQVKIYTLDNSDDWFDEATKLPATREWIERRIDYGKRIFMIVGFHTVTDASISQESVIANKADGRTEIPVNLSLAAAGIVMPVGGMADAGISVSQQGVAGAKSQYDAPGEQVWAVEYRELCHKWLSTKHIDNFRLSSVRQWPCMERMRDDEDGEEDVIEVELINMEGLGDDYDKYDRQTIGNDFLFIPPVNEQ